MNIFFTINETVAFVLPFTTVEVTADLDLVVSINTKSIVLERLKQEK